jgi:adenylate cyclase
VEIANRLRSANALYGTRIIISEALYREVKDRFRCRVLDSIRLPGETRGTPIYELRGDATTPDEADSTFIQACELAFASYLERAWESAIAAWQEALIYAPSDPACRLMIARCQHLQAGAAAALPDDWDGTVVDPRDPRTS